jgi:hypothetical protein
MSTGTTYRGKSHGMRPELGQKINAKDRLIRTEIRKEGEGWRRGGWRKGWRRRGEGVLPARPVDGIYIGYRTYSTGTTEYDSEYGHEYGAEEYYEVWLIVPDPRQKPVPVWPEDVLWRTK